MASIDSMTDTARLAMDKEQFETTKKQLSEQRRIDFEKGMLELQRAFPEEPFD